MLLIRTPIALAVAAVITGTVTVSTNLYAQATEPQRVERVEITGSNIKRIDAETAQPVQIITREDIQRSGATTVEQLMQTLSVTTSSGAFTTATSAGASNLGISTISLRGLDGRRTLILLNGRRITAYGGTLDVSSPVDVNSIPIAALERIEVLKDGASAVYGSDAIAGVVNFILRKDFRGTEFSLDYSIPEQGSAGRVARVSGIAGFGDRVKDKFNVMMMGSYEEGKALYGRDRDYAVSAINEQFLNDGTSGNTFPANIFIPATGNFNPLDGEGNPLGGASRNPLAPNCTPSVQSPFFSPRVCRYDPSPLVSLIPQTKRANLFGSLTMSLTPTLDAYFEAAVTRNESRVVIQPVPLSDQFAIPTNNPLSNQYPYTLPPGDPLLAGAGNGGVSTSAFVLRPTSPYYPTTYIRDLVGPGVDLPAVLVRYRSFGTGPRDTTSISTQPRVVAGLKGVAAGWDFDTAFLYSASDIKEVVNDGFPLLTRVLPLLNSGVVNPFGANTPEVQRQLDATEYVGTALAYKTSITSFGAKASRDLFQMGGGFAALAAGAEFRRETYSSSPDATIQTGDVSGYGGNQLEISRSRNVSSLFGELSLPVIKGVEVNAAVRYDKYSGTGNSTVPKIGLRWQPSNQVLVRASFGQGFRAPALADLYAPQTQGVTQAGVNDPLRCPTTNSSNDCATQFTTIEGGNPNLKPEKSDNITFGVVFEPTRNSSIAVDVFDIKLKDVIQGGIDVPVILGDLGRFGYLVTRGPNDPAIPGGYGPITSISQTYLNLSTLKVRGIDLDGKMRFDAGGVGKFTLRANGTYFVKFDNQDIDGNFIGALDKAGTVNGGVIPRWKHYIALDWSRGPWNATLAQSFQKSYYDIAGSFDDPTDPAYRARRVGAYEIWDTQVGYEGFRNTKLSFGVRNLFDRKPPYSNVSSQTQFQAGYDISYVDPRDRTFYARLTYSFK
jgi:iron complex outermembrane recepter protein